MAQTLRERWQISSYQAVTELYSHGELKPAPISPHSAAAVRNAFPISVVSVSSPGLHTYLPWVCANKGGVRSNNKGKAQDLFIALGRGNTKICQVKMKFRSPVARFSNISFWCMRNIDANPTARRREQVLCSTQAVKWCSVSQGSSLLPNA